MPKAAVHELAVNGGTPVRTKPFPSWPVYDETERRGLLRSLESGMWGGRPKPVPGEVTSFEAEFAEFHEAPAGLAVTNGTHAVQLALDLCGVKPGDHVLVPALTPIPTSNAVRQRGAIPIPVDVDPRTYCLDPRRLEEARTDRVTAVVVVHLSGHLADMDAIVKWAGPAGIAVVQDAAHAHGAQWQGRGIGAFGGIATFSFMQSKIMTAGEGGAILLPDADRYAEAFSRHCLGRSYDGGFSFETASSNYRLGEFAAAVLRGQLGRVAEQNARREQHWKELVDLVAQIPGVTPRAVTPGAPWIRITSWPWSSTPSPTAECPGRPSSRRTPRCLGRQPPPLDASRRRPRCPGHRGSLGEGPRRAHSLTGGQHPIRPASVGVRYRPRSR